jgi:HlyD family secretion protein
MKKLIPVVLIAAALGGYYIWRSRSAERDSGIIRFSANIEATQVDVAFPAGGKVIAIEAREGDRVRQGQVLARLDPEILEQQKHREMAAAASAEGVLAQMNTMVSWQQQTVNREVELRQAEVRQAEARLRDLQAGARSQEIEQAEAALNEARAVAQQARRDWERAQQLYKQEDISTQQFDQFRARFAATESEVRAAEQRVSLLKEGARTGEVEAARAAVARARAALELSEANRLQVRRQQQELATRRSDLDRARAQVAVIDSQIGDTTVVAPIDGVVLVKAAEVGEVLTPGTPVMSIGDLSRPWVRAYIPETQLGRVKLSDAVRITTDSFAGKEYRGRVSFISSEAEFTPKQIQTEEERVRLVYRIKVDVENPNQELKINMPVDGVIEAGQ